MSIQTHSKARTQMVAANPLCTKWGYNKATRRAGVSVLGLAGEKVLDFAGGIFRLVGDKRGGMQQTEKKPLVGPDEHLTGWKDQKPAE